MASTYRLAAVALTLLSGCGPGLGRARCANSAGAEILVVGDSVLFYNAPACASIGDVAGDELGLDVRIEARSGAKVNPRDRYLLGDIREQYFSSDWSWVIVNGGVNDLNQDCDCGVCDEVLDSIVSADGSRGDVPDLVDRALSDGARALLVGYYEFDPDAKYGFGECSAAVEELEARYQQLADSDERILFVDPSEVVSLSTTPAAYRGDGIHPTEEGSVDIGRQVAEAIRAAESSL